MISGNVSTNIICNMKKPTLLLFILLVFITTSFAQTDFIGPVSNMSGHPRILMMKGEENDIKKLIASDQLWAKMHKVILDESDRLLTAPPIERIQIGRRL